MAKARVLALVGSEMGGTRSQMKKVLKEWAARDGEKNYTVELVDGKQAVSSAADLLELPSKYDVILLATSSYGEGDPPESLGFFFNALLSLAESGEKPLAGMQHAVLGFGSSIYDTFQNCPRLCDKYLGECGSRRIAERAELDECHESMKSEVDQPSYRRWVDEVHAVLQALPKADLPPVCDWTVPESKVLYVTPTAMSGAGNKLGLVVLLGVAALGAAYYMQDMF